MVTVEIVEARSYAVGMDQPQPDDELFREFRAGSQAAYERLYRRHADALLSYIAARYPPPLDAEEIVQLAWLKANNAREKFAGGNFRGWLFKIAFNTALDEVRKRRKEILDSEIDAENEDSQHPMDRLIIDEETQALRDCLKSIDQKFAEALRLMYFEDLKYEEIAQRLDIEKGTVGSRIHRGREHLKNCLETRRLPK